MNSIKYQGLNKVSDCPINISIDRSYDCTFLTSCSMHATIELDSYDWDLLTSFISMFPELVYEFVEWTSFKEHNPMYSMKIKKVIFHDPATIVFWEDGTETVVKYHDGDKYDKLFGLMACMIKKYCGNNGKWLDIIRKYIPDLDEKNNE